ncbi:hypothetical protein E2C01_002459 [Portunus trituberculatus]|uniref:Uncharacterized protein n=1 Tax=Portunus trituberculatus TaxID=210409 RepID=A0A5B7CLZ8_PORTR|nr:hypothetical protein [Portunus trituberculatus]
MSDESFNPMFGVYLGKIRRCSRLMQRGGGRVNWDKFEKHGPMEPFAEGGGTVFFHAHTPITTPRVV